MRLRTLVASCALLLAAGQAFTAAVTNPKTIPASRSATAALVQRFLTARGTNQDAQAHALLSTETQRQTPMTAQSLTRGPAAEGMTPRMTAVALFFLDTHNTGGYRYFVLGALPTEPNVVLVRARPPGAADALLLKIVVAPDAVNGALRLDLMKSLLRTDPEALNTARQKAEQTSSLSNLKQIGLGIIQYAQDHNNTLPDADRWVDEVMPYLKSEPLFHDPSAPDGQRWSYAFNRTLSGKKIGAVDTPAATVIVFESTLGRRNASDAGASVPRPGWHRGGTDYVFVDGHARWLPDASRPSFGIH